MDRVSDSESGGRGFDSRHAYCNLWIKDINLKDFVLYVEKQMKNWGCLGFDT